MALLAGLHDREAAPEVPNGGWVLDTLALSEKPTPVDYDPSVNWIVRANWGYGSTGTLPVPEQYGEYVSRLVAYVKGSRNCSRWIVGNEPNLSREWPDGQPIFPHRYADCYRRARAAIHALPGHEHDEVLIAASGPWNAELKYPGNPNGDWIKYFEDVNDILGDEFDGFSLHSYTHGYNVALVTSSVRMQAPFQSRHFEFRTYRDYMEATKPQHRNKRVYLTEVNGNGTWKAVGLIPAMLNEIDNWNKSGAQPIGAVIFYRYPRYDEFYMQGRDDVMAEFRQAAQKYSAPTATAQAAPQEPTYMPSISTGASVPTQPTQLPVDWDERLTKRGIKLTQYVPLPGETYFRIIKGEYWEEKEHTFAEVLGKDGKRLPMVMRWWWADKEELKLAELKPGDRWMVDFPMHASGWSYGLEVRGGYPSDSVFGMGLGSYEQPNMGIHVSYKFTFQLTVAPKEATQPMPAQPTAPAPQPAMPALAHPVQNPAFRGISQGWKARPEYYSQFKVDEVPLQGHNGLDFRTSIGSIIVAVDTGRVVEVADESPKGYGKYIKLVHSWGESVYAHLDEQHVQVGETVAKGEIIGTSGNTGNSSGPHLHFGMRVSPFNRRDGMGGYSDPSQYLINVSSAPTPAPSVDLLPLIKMAATEFGLEWQLLASLVMAESTNNVRAVSPAGAMGLTQLMPKTWDEWSAKVGGTDPFNAAQNLRVGAAYLAWLLRYYKGDLGSAVTAYNMGPGNVDKGVPVPLPTMLYVAKVVFGADLLRAVGA